MLVFVQNQHGDALMPCKPRKARILLKQKKAMVVSYKPFTIKLFYGRSGYQQVVNVGVDLGAKHVGIAITSHENVLAKGEIELRQDIKSLLDTETYIQTFKEKSKDTVSSSKVFQPQTRRRLATAKYLQSSR